MKRILLVLLAGMLLVVTACSAPRAETRDTVRIAVPDDLIDVSVGNLSIVGDRIIAQNVYSCLVKFKPGTNEIVPDLATALPTVSADGKVLSFKLRQGVKFHFGYGELTSQDVKATIEWHTNPDNKSKEAGSYASVESVVCPDKYSVEIHLKDPFAGFIPGVLCWQAGFIVSAKALTELGPGLSTKPVGTGPFYLSNWVKGEKMVLTANPDYFLGAPKIKTVELKVIPEDYVAVLALERDEIDVICMHGVAGYRAVLDRPNISVSVSPSGFMNYLTFQCQKSPTNKPLVRQALAYALDLKAIEESLDGFGELNFGHLPPTVVGYSADIKGYEQNLDKARQLLADAGYANPADCKIEMLYTQGYLWPDISLMMADQWRELGVTVNVTVVDRALWSKARSEGNWNTTIWGPTRYDSDSYIYPFVFSTGAQNYAKYADPDADQLILDARKEMDPVRRAAIYKDLQLLLLEDLPYLNTVLQNNVVAMKPGWTGIKSTAYEGLFEFYEAAYQAPATR
jgi:peptide/nickel transport system substrate-binding protein